jgi:1-aminocyclopropane-1-carboxylate deaminase
LTPGVAVIDRLKYIEHKQVRVSILLTHEHHSGGNKYYKLKLNLEHARRQGVSTLLSFGGAWSNHIHALSEAGALGGFKTIGVIRGEPPVNPSAMLTDAVSNGMTLHYVSREQYRRKGDESFIESLRQKFGNFYLLPEGGSNNDAVLGCQEILNLVTTSDYDIFALSVGTGGTLAGIVSGLALRRGTTNGLNLQSNQKVIGYSSLKGAYDLDQSVQQMLNSLSNDEARKKGLMGLPDWHICHDYHFGGYAKFPDILREFLDVFERDNKIKLDPIYTAKMMYGVIDQIDTGLIAAGSRVLVIHTGGLQGRRGYALE